MGPWWRVSLKLLWAAYLLLTSLYCLLAFLPYTYYALIKAPPYEWLPWFAAHHAQLYWLGLLFAGWVSWLQRKRPAFIALFCFLAAAGTFIAVRPVLPYLHADTHAYVWSVAALIPVFALSLLDVMSEWPRDPGRSLSSLNYLALVAPATAIALLTILGTKVRSYAETRSAAVHLAGFELGVWSAITHVVIAIAVVSVLNLLFSAAAKTSRPRLVTTSAVVFALCASLSLGLTKFLDAALGFSGWTARVYAILLATTVVFLGLSLVLQLKTQESLSRTAKRGKQGFMVVGMAGLAIVTVALPSWVGAWDWHAVFQRAFALLLWVSFACGFSSLYRKPKTYSVPVLFAILLVTGFVYKGLQLTEIFWARPLGSTDDDIGRSMETYASQNVSFLLAHHLLGNAPAEATCQDLCRILRQYTNVRDATTKAQVNLVERLAPGEGDRPNIFIFVIDSMRPDYLGAYNAKVDFTPNMDAFAHDSVVFHNAYTQYAGTTLSEPAIWSGALLLHAHYVQPFPNVNSLEKLATTDGYKMIVSFDAVLHELLSPADDLIKLDTDKSMWTRFELCSTVQQMTSALDSRPEEMRPVFFYAQPMNVHQFAQNNQPRSQNSTWFSRGFNVRIAREVHQVDTCMGTFLSYLKSHGMYDNSIIILTSDHGDATGEFGRLAHSNVIYPEVMHVPLIVHLPKSMQAKFVYDQDRISTLTDIAPSIYYLLGHRPIRTNPIFGHPLFAESRKEVESFSQSQWFLASDQVAAYGLLTENGKYLYATYDSPARSFLFDLTRDPNAEHSILTPELKRRYDERIIDYLKMIGDFYGYKPGISSLIAAGR